MINGKKIISHKMQLFQSTLITSRKRIEGKKLRKNIEENEKTKKNPSGESRERKKNTAKKREDIETRNKISKKKSRKLLMKFWTFLPQNSKSKLSKNQWSFSLLRRNLWNMNSQRSLQDNFHPTTRFLHSWSLLFPYHSLPWCTSIKVHLKNSLCSKKSELILTLWLSLRRKLRKSLEIKLPQSSKISSEDCSRLLAISLFYLRPLLQQLRPRTPTLWCTTQQPLRHLSNRGELLWLLIPSLSCINSPLLWMTGKLSLLRKLLLCSERLKRLLRIIRSLQQTTLTEWYY